MGEDLILSQVSQYLRKHWCWFFLPLFCLLRLAAHSSFLVTGDCPEWPSSAWAAEDADNPELILMNLRRRLSVKNPLLRLFILLQNFNELSPLHIRWKGSIISLVKCKNKKGELSRQAVHSALCLWLGFMWEGTVMQTTDPTAYFGNTRWCLFLLSPVHHMENTIRPNSRQWPYTMMQRA